LLTNGNPIVQGTASDDVGIGGGDLRADFRRLRRTGRIQMEAKSITNYAAGTTNWSVNFTNANDSKGLFHRGTTT